MTFKTHKPLLKGKPITLKNHVPEGIPLVKGDENRVNQIMDLQVLSNFLSRDYKVRTFTSGQEVINLLNGHTCRPDLILLDIMMPGVSGLDVCAKIRKRFSIMKERFPDLFSGIINASEKIKRIVEYLRSFVKKGTEDITESIEINKVVESAVFLVSNLIKKSTDSFKINYGSDLPLVEGNFQRLEQVMVNLLKNACQALKSKKDGITVSTYVDNQRNVVIEIEDEGIGMDEDTKNRIMEPFFTTKNEGIGLGLFISFKIIKTHKGGLTFISGPNKGIRAIISLPIKSYIRSEIYYNERKFTS